MCDPTTRRICGDGFAGVKSVPAASNGGFSKLGVPFWGPYHKGCSILGFILWSPNLGKLPND